MASSGVQLLRASQAIEQVELNGLRLALLASGDGVEIIKHHLKAGTDWAIGPAEGWNSMEWLMVTKGVLRMETAETTQTLRVGDSVGAQAITEDILFQAQTDSEFVYVSSQPVFHYYSQHVMKLMDLAVAIETKDGYTKDHCARIKELATAVGWQMNLPPTEMYNLNVGSFLHDVGKTRVPIAILNKPAKLTEDEWDLMKRHTTLGKQVLLDTNLPYLREPAEIAEQHHERFDGSGYPYGLSGSQIRIESAIVAVVDSFDAMTTDRPYHSARCVEEAINEIVQLRGKFYHPNVVDAFIQVMQQGRNVRKLG